jgi:hypothetical protein
VYRYVFTFLISASVFATTPSLVEQLEAAAVVHILDPVAGTGRYDLVPNGGFETGMMTNWTLQQDVKGEFQASSEESFEGSFSAKSITKLTRTGNGYAASQTLPVIPNTDYVLSAFFLRSSLSDARMYVDLWDVPYDIQPFGLKVPGWQFSYGIFNTGSDNSVNALSAVGIVVFREFRWGVYSIRDHIPCEAFPAA